MSDTYAADPYTQFVTPGPQSAPPQAAAALPSPTTMAESGNNPAAKNPNSSAAGPGQFIDSTWLGMIKKYRPDIAANNNDQQILALRTDPKQTGLSNAMTNAYAAENSEALSNAGLPSNPGNVYLAHFAGPQGAIGILKADPNTPAGQILGPAAVKANPFLANMTAGQVQQWATGKVGGPPEGYYGGRMHVTVPAQQGNDPYAQFTGNAQSNQGQINPAWDFARSIPGGLVSGLGGVLSASNNAANLEMAQPNGQSLTPDQASGAIEQNVTGPLPTPQGRAGQFGRTIGEFAAYAPFSPVASPAGIIANVARSIVPAVLSEAGGQAASGTPYESIARAGGAIAGGLRGGVKSQTATAAAIPTTEQLLSSAKAGYQSIPTAAKYAPDVMDGLVTKINNDLRQNNARDYLAPGAFRAVQELKDEPTIQGIHNVRGLLGSIAQNGNKFEGRASALAQQHIDNFLRDTNPTTAATIKEADANYAAGMRSKKIETAQDVAGLRAGRAGYGGNSVNAMRQVLYPILEKAIKGKTQGLSSDEISAIRDIVEGTPITNTLRGGGMFSPAKGAFSMASGIGGGMAIGGPAGAFAVPILGAAAGKLANVLTSNQIDKLGELVRKRSPLYQKAVAETARQYSSSVDAFGASPSSQSFIKAVVAARNLAAGFRKDGINISSGDLLKQVQGPMPAGADPYQKEVGGKPSE